MGTAELTYALASTFPAWICARGVSPKKWKMEKKYRHEISREVTWKFPLKKNSARTRGRARPTTDPTSAKVESGQSRRGAATPDAPTLHGSGPAVGKGKGKAIADIPARRNTTRFKNRKRIAIEMDESADRSEARAVRRPRTSQRATVLAGGRRSRAAPATPESSTGSRARARAPPPKAAQHSKAKKEKGGHNCKECKRHFPHVGNYNQHMLAHKRAADAVAEGTEVDDDDDDDDEQEEGAKPNSLRSRKASDDSPPNHFVVR